MTFARSSVQQRALVFVNNYNLPNGGLINVDAILLAIKYYYSYSE